MSMQTTADNRRIARMRTGTAIPCFILYSFLRRIAPVSVTASEGELLASIPTTLISTRSVGLIIAKE